VLNSHAKALYLRSTMFSTLWMKPGCYLYQLSLH